MKKRVLLSASIIIVVLAVDQLAKILVKTRMHLYEHIDIASWFQIFFTENHGMAFGMDFVGTLFLTLFRLLAVGLFVWILFAQIKRCAPLGLIACLALIIAGAFGNIVDNTLYGLIFTASSPMSEPAQLVAFGQGYGSLFEGRVVDMLYFPLFEWPTWMPLVGGSTFFGAVFNVADSAISVGAVALAVFYHRHFFSRQ